MMHATGFKQRSQWQLWGLGLLTSMLAFATSPLYGPEYPLTAATSLLFLWGLIRSD